MTEPLRTQDDADAELAVAVAGRAQMFVDAFTGPQRAFADDVLDYSRESLAAVDAFIDIYFQQKVELPEQLVWLVSCYVLEVGRREFGGRFLPGPEGDPIVLVIGEPGPTVGVMVFGKVVGRSVNGPEDNLPFFFSGIAPAIDRGTSATLV